MDEAVAKVKESIKEWAKENEGVIEDGETPDEVKLITELANL